MQGIFKNISGRILITVYGAMAVLCAYFVVSSHLNYTRSVKADTLSKLHSISKTLSVQIEGDRMRRMLEKYPEEGSIISSTQDAYYYVMHNNMSKAAELNGIEMPIRTLSLDTLTDQFVIGATSEKMPRYREVYTGNTEVIRALYDLGGTVDPEEYENAEMLTAFTPLIDRKGNTSAVLMVETSFTELLQAGTSRLWRNIGISVGILLLVGLVLFKSIRHLLANEEESKRLLEEVNAIIAEKNQNMTDSIEYAAKVQRAIIPRAETLELVSEECFVLNKPKDILSGDFYWFHQINENEYYVATVDCTGHGVPGAIMSAIGCSLLNEIVLEKDMKRPSQILTRLNKKILGALHQHGKAPGSGDGMDIALCRIDKRTNKIIFSGAKRPLYWIHKEKLEMINGNRFPIGGSHYEADRQFSDHHLHYDDGDKIYMFSDGYADQFGGPENKKFMVTQLNEFIEDNHHLPMAEQHQKFDATFEAWRGAEEQVDDVCMVGLLV